MTNRLYCLKLSVGVKAFICIILASLTQGSLLAQYFSNVYASISNETTTPPVANLQVWNPVLRSSNITSTTLFPVGSELEIRVNITNAGPIKGFDLTLGYMISNELEPVILATGPATLSGGIFDPNNPPPGCDGILPVRNDVLAPPYAVFRVLVVVQGNCTIPGNGVLLTVHFRVTRIGATSIDIVQTSRLGKIVSVIVGADLTAVPVQFGNAYFRNKAGTPPVAQFSYSPLQVDVGQSMSFDAMASYDPDNSAGGTDKGIKRFIWDFGDSSVKSELNQVSHIFQLSPTVPVSGIFSVRLVVIDEDDLPSRLVVVVYVSPGILQAVSTNWSGYAVSGAPGSVTNVRGSWIVPAIGGPCPSVDQYSAFWVGIDGFNSETVEQTGTISACIKGAPVYYAWYEFYPHIMHRIPMITVSPGDVISAEVSFSSSRFTVTIADLTTGKSFSKSAKVNSAQLSSAEWVAEAPSSKDGTLPLANFGRFEFGPFFTGIPNSSDATVGGVTGTIGSFKSGAYVITMLSSDFTVKALPSTLSPDGTSFTVQWTYSGP